MIRFSAGLVAVAIGVLIGGIATSRLLLVYIAIVLSAVALVALAIGVALKRNELFGEAQRTVPAQAGTGPVVSARASGREDQNRSNGHVTPTPPQEAAVGPGAAFARTGQAASPQSRGTWENRTGDDSRSSPVTASSSPAARQAAAPFGTPPVGEPPAPWDRAVRGGGTAPRTPGAPAQPAFEPRSASTSSAARDAGPGADLPDWFSPSVKAASAGSPAPGTGAASSWANADATAGGDKGAAERGKPAAAPSLADDGWPARYSWLDGKPTGSGDTSDGKSAGTVEGGTVEGGTVEGGTVEAGQEGAAPERGSPVARVDAGPQDVVMPDVSASPEAPDAGSRLAASAEADEPAAPRLVRDPAAEAPAAEAPAAEAPAAEAPAAEAPAAEAGKPAVPGEPEGEPSAATTAADDTGLVTVVRGVPRFHQRDCVLIRFMSDDDTERLPVAQAKEAGCTPCAACQSD